jgi:hypothetical protein
MRIGSAKIIIRPSHVPMARMDRFNCVHDSRRSVHSSQMPARDLLILSAYHTANLQIRIYALYSLNKKLLVVMLILYFACSACSAWIIVTELSSLSSMDSHPPREVCSRSDYFFLSPLTSHSADSSSRWQVLLNPPPSSWNFQILDSHAII